MEQDRELWSVADVFAGRAQYKEARMRRRTRKKRAASGANGRNS